MSPNIERIRGLDGLRGLLAIWVLIYHVLTISGWWQHLPERIRVFAEGGRAVDVFIMLSGFVIPGLLLSQRETYFSFLLRRYVRLMPVLVFCIILAFAAQAFGFMPIRFTSSDFPQLLVAHLALLHGAIPNWWISGASGAFLNPAWSISLEWQFYLIAPFLVSLAARGGWRFLLGSLICVVMHRILAPQLNGFSQAFLPFNIQLFWIGLVTFLGYQWWTQNPSNRDIAQPVAIAALVFLILIMPYKDHVGLIVWMTVVVMLTGQWQPVWRVACSNQLAALGSISYPIYLAHEPIIWTLVRCINVSSASGLMMLLAATLTLTILVSLALHRYIEMPAINFGKRLFTDTRPMS